MECPEFTFHSSQHQRYQSGIPVMGLQTCGRTVKVEKNVRGCSGYQLRPGDGYIVRMINDDIQRDQMAPKPMRVIASTPERIELRGYPTVAQTPFGWQDFDLSDYALTVYLSNGTVTKCVLHMTDRNVDLEYRK
ncbi:MAG: hypothetical protein K2O88_08410 [Paramuribaculum sp.]|nr:hypothetical protein [Paramuribaculum sp.]